MVTPVQSRTVLWGGTEDDYRKDGKEDLKGEGQKSGGLQVHTLPAPSVSLIYTLQYRGKQSHTLAETMADVHWISVPICRPLGLIKTHGWDAEMFSFWSAFFPPRLAEHPALSFTCIRYYCSTDHQDRKIHRHMYVTEKMHVPEASMSGKCCL